jgi:hypothetical protein
MIIMVLVDSFIQATSESDETSVDSVQAYLFGKIPDSKEQPVHTPINTTIKKIEKLGQFYKSYEVQSNLANDIQIPFYLVNGLPFYWVMGKATHTTPDTKQTIGIFDVTNAIKPRLSCIQGLDTSTPSNHVIYGSMIHNLTLHHEPGKFTSCILQAMGCKHELSTDTPTTPIYPSSKSGLFDVFNHLKWGADGSEATLSSVLTVDLGIAQSGVSGYEQGAGYYENLTHLNPIEAHINFTLYGTNNTILADAIAGTKRSLLFKISDSSDLNRYIELDSNGATAIVESIVEIRKIDEIIAYNIGVLLENPVITVQDYLDDDFYSIPAGA